MSRQKQSNERGAGMRSIFTVQQLSVHQALSCDYAHLSAALEMDYGT